MVPDDATVRAGVNAPDLTSPGKTPGFSDTYVSDDTPGEGREANRAARFPMSSRVEERR